VVLRAAHPAGFRGFPVAALVDFLPACRIC